MNTNRHGLLYKGNTVMDDQYLMYYTNNYVQASVKDLHWFLCKQVFSFVITSGTFSNKNDLVKYDLVKGTISGTGAWFHNHSCQDLNSLHWLHICFKHSCSLNSQNGKFTDDLLVRNKQKKKPAENLKGKT